MQYILPTYIIFQILNTSLSIYVAYLRSKSYLRYRSLKLEPVKKKFPIGFVLLSFLPIINIGMLFLSITFLLSACTEKENFYWEGNFYDSSTSKSLFSKHIQIFTYFLPVLALGLLWLI